MSVPAEALYLFVVCWLLAQVEIHIEGAHGWAEKLPTWRISHGWVMRLTNGKPLTGYHVYLTAFLVALFHLPAVFMPWSWALEGRILSVYLLTTVFWDFQWFVWNPAWGTRRFFREKVWWFPKRLAGFPVEYYLGVGGSLAATALLDPPSLYRWSLVVCGVAAATAASVVLAGRLRPRA